MSKHKYDTGKARLDLVPPRVIQAVGIIRTYGNEKYSGDTYKLVEPYRYRAALMRHLVEYLIDPKSIDKESGYPHLWHLTTNAAFLCELEWDTYKRVETEAKEAWKYQVGDE